MYFLYLAIPHLFDDDTVITGAVQPQVLQDGSHLQQSQSVTGERQRQEDWAISRREINSARNSSTTLKDKNIGSQTISTRCANGVQTTGTDVTFTAWQDDRHKSSTLFTSLSNTNSVFFTSLSVRGTLFRRCLLSWVFQKFALWTGILSWSYLSGYSAQFRRDTCRCTFSHICKTHASTKHTLK